MTALLLPELVGLAALTSLAASIRPVAAARRLPKLARDALLALAALTAGITIVAMVAHAVSADDFYQRILPFDGTSRDGTWSDAASILLANVRIVVTCLAAGLIVAWAQAGYPADQIPAARQLLISICDGILAIIALMNVAIVGVMVGAYGTALTDSLFPHALLELPAFAVAAAAYIGVRRSTLPSRAAVAAWAGASAALIPAAILETFVG